MASPEKPDVVLADALDVVANFVRQVTGLEPTPVELADALTRYFVLNEIKDHIEMMREDGDVPG